MMPSGRPSLSDAAIVKLGGSLAYSPYLRAWLAACRNARRAIIIVPGGGPFADAVRDAQARMGLSDSAAHRMALLAMAQFGEALASLEPGFMVAQGFEGLELALEEGATPIWVPLELVSGGMGIEESWDVTSDSLAAWLATALGARMVVLVKQVSPSSDTVSADEMSELGVADRAFPAFATRAGLDVIWLGVQDFHRLDDALHGEVPPLAIHRQDTAHEARAPLA